MSELSEELILSHSLQTNEEKQVTSDTYKNQL